MQLDVAAANPSDGFARGDRRVRRGSDYDACYRALDLTPGAPLPDIEDRARLLRAAFHPESLPTPVRKQAEERAERVEAAVEALQYYWQTYRKAPPSADLGGAEGLLDALVEALGDSVAATEDDDAAADLGVSALPAAVDRPRSLAGRRAFDPGRHSPPARSPAQPPGAAIALPAPVVRMHRIEVAALLVHRHVFEFTDRPKRTIRSAARPLALPPPRPPAAPPLQVAAAVAPPPLALPAPPPAANGEPQQSRRRRRRRAPRFGRSSVVTLGVAGLAVVLAVLLQHYALERNLPAAASDAASASASQRPPPPPPAPAQPDVR